MNSIKSPRIIIPILVIVALALVFIFWKNPNQEKASAIFPKEQVQASDVVIRQTSDGFMPAEISVKKGTRVVWINETSTYIWPASDLHPTHERYPAFDVLEPIPSNQAWGFTFDKVGSWSYHDHLFPRYRGTVNVSE
jgi:plastocyanin